MRHRAALFAAVALTIAVGMLASPFCLAKRGGRSLDQAEVDKITDACPGAPSATPKKSREMLVFSVTNGFRHGSIPYGAKALKIMGRKTGAYDAIVSDDLSNFEPANIKHFDVICFNNTTGELFVPKNVHKLPAEQKRAAVERDARLKESFLSWVRAGGGVVGLHAATDSFYQWPEFGQMMGGYFDGHPWNEKVFIKNEDREHPINVVLGGEDLVVVDEIYQIKAPYSRRKLRVLLSLDVGKCNMKKRGIKRKDNDFAVSWIQTWGKGRVYYMSLGHRNEIFWNPVVMKHILAGIQFAAGDLAADTTPSAKRTGK